MSADPALKQLHGFVERLVDERMKTHGFIVPRASGVGAALAEQAESVQPVANGGWRETRVFEGFDLLATDPPGETVRLTNRFVRPGEQNVSKGISNGVYVGLTGGVEIGLAAFLNPDEPRVIYICYDKGYEIRVDHPRNKIVCGKVVIQKGSLSIRDDKSVDSLDAYIVGHDDPFFDNSMRVDDDTIAAFGNALQSLLASNVYGTITLNNALKILSADGKLNIEGNSIKIYDSSGNLMMNLDSDSLDFWDDRGRLIMSIGPNGNFVSALEILDEKSLAIRDNNNVTRVLLGMLQSNPKQRWGFEMYNEKGKAFMSTTRNRSWFSGGNVGARLLAIPAFVFAVACGTTTATSDDSQTIPRSGYGLSTITNVTNLAGASESINIGTRQNKGLPESVFDGDNIWFKGARIADPAYGYMYKINILIPADTYNANNPPKADDFKGIDIGGTYPGYIRGVTYAKDRVWMVVEQAGATTDTPTTIQILSINIIDSTVSLAYEYTAYGADSLIFDGLYLYQMGFADWAAGPSIDYEMRKYSFNDDYSLSLVANNVFLADTDGGWGGAILDIENNCVHQLVAGVGMYKINKDSLALEETFSKSVTNWGQQGLTFDALYIYVTDIINNIITRVNASDYTDSIDIRTSWVNELAFDGRYVWFQSTTSDLTNIDIYNGSIVGSVDISPGNVYRGLIFDGMSLWGHDGVTISRVPR